MADEFTLDGDSLTVTPTSIDDTDSPYTTQGEQYINVDTTNGPVTVELATADVVAGRVVKIHDEGENASANPITVTTEGSATIAPAAQASISITVDGAYARLECNGTNWLSDRAAEKQSLDTDRAVIGEFDGNITEYHDVSSSRTGGTEERNTDNTNRLVSIRLKSDGTQTIAVQLAVGSASGSLVVMDEAQIHAGDISDRTVLTVSAEIPPGYYYKLGQYGDNDISINGSSGTWMEANRK